MISPPPPDRIDLPALTSIQMGENAFAFDNSDKSSTLIMRGTEVDAN